MIDSMETESPPSRSRELESTPLATVRGIPLTELPRDLYIPPDALEIFLEAFEGPLDLLLYLIKRQNLNILDIPIAQVTQQYIGYVDLMMSTLGTDNAAAPDSASDASRFPGREVRFELVAEYLVMAAMLAEIKSRMLLPRPKSSPEEDDPRAELVRRLQEYERFKTAAEGLDCLPRVGRETFALRAVTADRQVAKIHPEVDLRELLLALKDVLARAEMSSHHQVRLEPLSVRERMTRILSSVREDRFMEFTAFFLVEEGRQGVIVTLLALLELIKESLIELIQAEPFAPIYVKAAG